MKNSASSIGRIGIAALAIAALAGTLAGPLNAAGTSSAQFLKLGAGARAAGMGDAFVAVADDATGAYWNPAGLGQIQSPEIAFMHNDWLVDTQYQYAGGVLPLERGVIGLSIQRIDYGDIDRYTAADARDGSFDAGSMAANLSFGFEMRDGLYLGGTAKYLQEAIETEKASSFAGDAGVLYRWDRYSVGAALQNIGPALKMVQESYDLPQTLRLGAAGRFLNERLLMGLAISAPNDNDPAVHAGAEFRLNSLLAFRGGYSAAPGNNLDVDGLTGVTAGLGITLNAFTLDYALVPFGDLGMTHRASIRVRFAAASY